MKNKIIKLILASILLFSATFSFTACTKPPEEEETDLTTPKGNVIMRFTAMSDIHYHDGSDTNYSNNIERTRFKAAIDKAYELTNNNLDAFLVLGDFSEGRPSEYTSFAADLKGKLNQNTKIIAIRGNHDGTPNGFVTTFDQALDTVVEVNGINFVAISSAGDTYTAEQNTWLNTQLKALTAADSKKPVFVLIHKGATNTVWNTDSSLGGGLNTDVFSNTLIKYPQAVLLSGHTHNPNEDDRVIYQKYYTAYSVGTMQRIFIDSPAMDNSHNPNYGGDVPLKGYETGGQFVIVEVTDQNWVSIKRYGIYDDDNYAEAKSLGRDFNINIPAGRAGFLYTDGLKFKDSTVPVFPADAISEMTLTSGGTGKLDIFFPQATSNTTISYYTIKIVNKTSGMLLKSFNIAAPFYYHVVPENFEYTLNAMGAVIGNEYEMKITATNSAKQVSAEISKTFVLA